MNILRLPPEAFSFKQKGPQTFPSAIQPLKTEAVYVEMGKGIQTKFIGIPYPVNGFLVPEALASVDVVKKYIRHYVDLFFSFPVILALPLLSFRRKQLLWHLVEMCQVTTNRYLLIPNLLPRCIVEIQRVFNDLDWMGAALRDFACVFLTNDRPYRYRVQDAVTAKTMQDLAEHPVRGMWKFASQFVDRDKNQDGTPRRNWKLFRLFAVLVAIRYPKQVRKYAEKVWWAEFQMDDADFFWAVSPEEFYRFGGHTKEELNEAREKLLVQSREIGYNYSNADKGSVEEDRLSRIGARAGFANQT